MPYFDGLGEGRFHRLKVLNAPKSKVVTTDDAFARSIRHSRYARRISIVSWAIVFTAMLVLLFLAVTQ